MYVTKIQCLNEILPVGGFMKLFLTLENSEERNSLSNSRSGDTWEEAITVNEMFINLVYDPKI